MWVLVSKQETAIWPTWFLIKQSLSYRWPPGGVCPLREGVPHLLEPSGSWFLRLLLHGQPGPSAHQGVLPFLPEILRGLRKRGVLYHRNRTGWGRQSPRIDGSDSCKRAHRTTLISTARSRAWRLFIATRILSCAWRMPIIVHRKNILIQWHVQCIDLQS
jgi:hypothetical protein